MTLGQMIRDARIKKKISQQELANRIGVTKGAVSQWETGHGAPKRSNAAPLAKELGISKARLEAYLMSGLNLLDGPPNGPEIPLYDIEQLLELASESATKKGVRAKLRGSRTLVGDIDTPADAVAARIADDSMAPEYLPGDIVIFSKHTPPSRNDAVVAVVDSDQVVLRCYEPRGKSRAGEDVFDLVCLSPDYSTISSNSGRTLAVLGTVIEHRKKRRS